MRLFARFNIEGYCVGHIQSSDPSFKPDPEYTEIWRQSERDLILSGRSRRIANGNGQYTIVPA